MNAYKAIIYKDIKTLGALNLGLFCLFPAAISVCCLLGKKSVFFLVYGMCLFFEFPLSALYFDLSQGWDSYGAIYPISRKTAVSCKFFQLLLQAFFAVVLIEAAATIGNLLHGGTAFNLYNLIIISAAALLCALISGSLFLIIMGRRFLSIGLLSLVMGFAGGFYGGNIAGKGMLFDSYIDIGESFSFMLSCRFHAVIIAVSAAVFGAVWILTSIMYKRRDL